MNNILHINGPAPQVHSKLEELIRAGINPVLVHQNQPVRHTSHDAVAQNDKSSYAKQVVVLGRTS